ncbi:MAG: superoxide dismutase [Mycobacteriales bacterium]
MHRSAHRLTTTTALLLGVAATATVTGSPVAADPADRVVVEGPLVDYADSWDEDARARVQAVYDGAGRSTVQLHVWGLAPDTDYGAHAHTNPCGAAGADAGPHFQHEPDPVSPSTDPEYANPSNEIWLDLTTNSAGHGVATTRVPWQFSQTRRARSVILHVEHTHTGPQDSGVAGARLGCLDVPF